MAADFTRFDFHAKKFYFSESVQVMSAEEVGQYLLLLVSAWLGAKDASLPDSPKLLAKMARVETVSDAVLDMFPVVETEHGKRRRNETLYEEWQAAVKRSEGAAQKARQRWGIDEAEPQQCNSTASAILSPSQAVSKSIQACPTRPESAQSVSSRMVLVSQPKATESGLTEEREAVASHSTEEQQQEPDFKFFRRTWLNKKLRDLGRDKDSVGRYNDACSKYGAAKVHAAVDSWATPKTIEWMLTNNVRSQYGLFLSQLERTIERMADDKTIDIPMIEADALIETIPAALSTPADVAATDDAILQMAAEENRQRALRKAKFTTPTDVITDPEKFLE